jgi:hypothetical protein
MPSHSLSPLASSKLLSHALSHPSSPVLGLLLGPSPETVLDAAPVAHGAVTALLLDAALNLADEQWGGDRGVVGLYVASASVSDAKPPSVALEVMAQIEARVPGAVLVVLNNKRLGEGDCGGAFGAFRKDGRGRHLRSVEEGAVEVVGGGKVGEGRVWDLEETLEGGLEKPDWTNPGFS